MNAFDKLKEAAQTTVAVEKVTTEGWAKSHRAWLFAVGLAGVIGFILAKTL